MLTVCTLLKPYSGEPYFATPSRHVPDTPQHLVAKKIPSLTPCGTASNSHAITSTEPWPNNLPPRQRQLLGAVKNHTACSEATLRGPLTTLMPQRSQAPQTQGCTTV